MCLIRDDLPKQPDKSCIHFVYYFLAAGDSMYINDAAQLLALVQGGNEKLEVTQELAEVYLIQRWIYKEEVIKVKHVIEKLKL